MSAVDVRSNAPMERIEVELFTDGGNDAVVRLPGRRFPGVVIQGDSLHALQTDVAEVVELCAGGNLGEAVRAEPARRDACRVRHARGVQTRLRGY
ncbi:DUF6959 family protein [Streptomyces sp. NPDC048441]|uniref:DUF6959 family protein n=1 Tax=Streptomyces sp. NPDC048441 TaxID=3365552 RepID=UPI00372297F1